MMFLDASAIVAILASEPEATRLEVSATAASKTYASPLTFYEAVLGLARAKRLSIGDAKDKVKGLLSALETEMLPVTGECGASAISAFERYGKGRHPAALNMGDCFAYACAQELGVPLLFKGDDFSKTDIDVA
jgi:ribonuclease VapC